MWFDVDRDGLAKLVEQRGKVFVLHELLQNAWDTRAKQVSVKITKIPNAPKATIEILDDDPDGFKSLDHAWTLFAPSEKKADAEKRGRFNLGEKLVLAVCYEAEIHTTTGGVVFDAKGRHVKRQKRSSGSFFRGTIRMTNEEYAEILAAADRLIQPPGVMTTVNLRPLKRRFPFRTIEITLPTVHADAEGFLRKTARKTRVEIYGAGEGEPASLYEMGIPICETGDRWSYNVLQKVPLNMDRDGVAASYLQTIRVAVLNAMADVITAEDAASTWVRDAAADERVEKPAFEQVIQERFGEKVAVYDPSDVEANMNVVGQGYTLIKGAQLSGGEWTNLKRFEIAAPAGRIAPTDVARFSPDGKDTWIPREKWTDGQKQIADFAAKLAVKLLDLQITIGVLCDIEQGWDACYRLGERGHRVPQLVFNLGRLGKEWFERGIDEHVLALLLHEYAHEIESNHLDHKFHDAITTLGAKLWRLALDDPRFFA